MRIILDVPLALGDLLFSLGIDSTADGIIAAVCTDSKEAECGDVFFPLAKNEGERARHSAEARERGAIVIGEQKCKPTFSVSSARTALLKSAELYLSRLPCLKRRVGITGSVGKTTVTRYLSRLLSTKWRVHSTLGNFNNAVGLSLSILSAPIDTEVIVLEMGMNARGEIAELAAAVRPNLAVITNIGSAHIGMLGSRAAIAAAKLEIVVDSTRAVILPFGEPLLFGVRGALTYGFGNGADIRLQREERTVILPFGRVVLPDLGGEHTELNLCAAVGAAYALGLTAEEIALGLSKITENDSRARRIPLGSLTVIDDSYNSSPEAVRAMLDLLRLYGPPYSVLLSDMLELGDSSESLHRDIGIYAARAGVSSVFAVGEYSACIRGGAIGAGLDGRCIHIYPLGTNASVIIDDILTVCKSGTLLIKGSHATGLNKIADELIKLGERNE